MPGWPKECNFTDNKAKRILYAVYKSGQVTWPQLRAVRRTLSYTYELVTGGNEKSQTSNWPGVKNTWKTFTKSNLLPTESCLPLVIPTPKELKKAFNKPWTPRTPMSFMKWAVGQTAAWDWAVCGARSVEDIKRIKFSPTQVLNINERWHASKFRGGRAKLAGTKKGTREWWVYRVCLCPGQFHISPPANFINRHGNPTVAIRWNTNCPIACIELLNSLCEPTQQRVYPKWLKSGRFGSSNVDNVVDLAIDWFIAQGVCPSDRRYDTHAGRKALARWCRKLNTPYRESFEIHGDLFETWSEHYEDDVPGDKIQRRNQSRNPDECTRALCRLANWFGKGKQVKPQLSRHERYMHHHMFLHGEGHLAHKIAQGLPSDDEKDPMDTD